MSIQSKGKSSSDTRRDNANTVRSIVGFLRKIIENPSDYCNDSNLIAQLKRQRGLETLQAKDFAMDKLALGTIKSCLDDPRYFVIENGWTSLEKLRKGALASLVAKNDKTIRPNKQTKAGLEVWIKEDQAEISQLWDEVAHLTYMFQEALILAKEFADKCTDPGDQALYQKRLRIIMAMFSPINRPKKKLQDQQ